MKAARASLLGWGLVAGLGCGDSGEAETTPPSTSGTASTADDGPGSTDASGDDTPADGTTAASDGPGSSDGGTETTEGGVPDGWLVVQGNRIVHADGSPFHGRGANLHDERSCGACSFAPPVPDGIDRWADELIDGWHANFIRFDLSAKDAPYNEFELQWESLVDDPTYFADIVQNVEHMTSKPGVYVLVTLFADPTVKPNNGDYDSEWPSSLGDTNSRYTMLAEAFHDDPQVLFGLTNEPHTTPDHDAELAAVYADAIAAIRAVEDGHGTPHHIVVVQAPEGWARDLSYFVENPLAGDQIAYEVHPYNPARDFDALLVQPGRTLPIIIGEYGPADGYMNEADIMELWVVAQANEIPYIAWSFHQRCPPNLLQDTAPDGCGLDAATGYDFPRTTWGDLLYDHLATPW
ncbi:MAG: cellulase family glycosylhydrolase [Myxococcales bacterium]|nr:cellulase family glycosylhydrolase [Myxococcales bacterium]